MRAGRAGSAGAALSQARPLAEYAAGELLGCSAPRSGMLSLKRWGQVYCYHSLMLAAHNASG
jgi:hypothetical protein